jgi:hypothetical protein
MTPRGKSPVERSQSGSSGSLSNKNSSRPKSSKSGLRNIVRTTLDFIDPELPIPLAERQPVAFIDVDVVKKTEAIAIHPHDVFPYHIELEEAPAYLQNTVLSPVLQGIHELLSLIKNGKSVNEPLLFLAKVPSPQFKF